jgi:short-subunit dehydrogenase
MVITGATSGIGKATALMAGLQGALLVLAARNEETLQLVAEEVERLGARATVVAADVGTWEEVQQIAHVAISMYGRIDTWVNNAGVGVYATVEDLTVEEIERVIRVDLLGSIYGTKAALEQMIVQGEGAIITIASVAAERSLPLQAPYCAAKHGLKGFTESLRLELERVHPGIWVTLIEPSSVNSPFFRHARSKVGRMPQPFPPAYEPEIVAESVLFAATRRRRTIVVGGAGKALIWAQKLSPSLVDRWMMFRNLGFQRQLSDLPPNSGDTLLAPATENSEISGEFGDLSLGSSPYTQLLEHHPNRKRLVGALALSISGYSLRQLTRR